MKLVSAQYDKNDKSTEALSAKSEALNKKLDVQKNKVEILKKQYNEMASQYDANTQKNETLAKKYDEEKKKLDALDATLGTTSREYKDQAEVVGKLEAELKKSQQAQDANTKSMSDLRIQLNGAEAEVAKTTREVDALAKEMEDGAKSGDDLGKSLKEAGDGAESANGGFTVFKGALADIVANVITSAINKMKELISTTIQVGSNFQASMSKVQAISGATDEDMKLLTETAKKFGSTTKFSASESADALGYMALAGWDAKTSASALGGVLDLASASGMDLARASDMVTDYLSAFQMEADQSAYFADILAYAQGNANTSAEQLGEAYKNCSANLASAGQDIETTTALLSMLANQGLKGSEAGTALNAVVRDMTSKMKDGAIQIGDTRIAVTDAEGNFRDLSDILLEVEKATDGMGTAQKASALQSTFTADSIKGLNLILNAGVDEAISFEKALKKSNGTASRMAKTMSNNLNGDMTALNSQIEGVQIALYEKFEPALRKGVEALSGLVDVISWLIDHSSEVVSALTAMATAVGAYLAYTTALKVMEGGWTALTIVTKAQTVAQAALNAVMSANPIGIVIALVAGLVAGFVTLWNTSEDFREFWISLWESIKSVAEPIITGLVEWFKNAWDNIKAIWEVVADFFSGVWENIKVIFEPVVEYYRMIFSTAWEAIKAVWDTVVDYFSSIWETIKGIFAVVKAVLSGNFGDAWEAIKGIVGTWADYFSGIWERIKNVFSPVITYFKEKFSDAWEAIKNVFSPVGKFFSDMWTTIKSKFTDIGQKIGDAIGSAFKNAINAVLATAEKVLNAPIKAINDLIGKINDIPGINLSKLSTFTLPRLAKGGVVDGATLAEIGEDGAEAIVPLENNTGWITKVANQLANALVPAFTSIRNAQTQPQSAYNDTVEAFKEALGQMQITLDDEQVGQFVDKTVANAIFN